MKKAGLVLEGGATRGVFTAGALDYLMEKELYLPYVVGVSAGSCNAVDYVSRQRGRTRDCMVLKDRKYDYMKIKNIVRHKSLFDMDMIFDRYPNELFPFDYDTYFASETECEMVVTNCLTGKAQYLDERQEKKRLMDICRASSSMPFASPVTYVDGQPCLDGGIADSIPIKRAMAAGCKKIVLILTRNPGYRKKSSGRSNRLYRLGYQKQYPKLAEALVRRAENYNKTLKLVERLEQENKIFVLRPRTRVVGRTERNYEVLHNFYQHGYECMKQEFQKLNDYLNR